MVDNLKGGRLIVHSPDVVTKIKVRVMKGDSLDSFLLKEFPDQPVFIVQGRARWDQGPVYTQAAYFIKHHADMFAQRIDEDTRRNYSSIILSGTVDDFLNPSRSVYSQEAINEFYARLKDSLRLD